MRPLIHQPSFCYESNELIELARQPIRRTMTVEHVTWLLIFGSHDVKMTEVHVRGSEQESGFNEGR